MIATALRLGQQSGALRPRIFGPWPAAGDESATEARTKAAKW